MRRAHRVRQPQHTTWVGVAWVLALLTPFWSLAATTVSLSAPTANQTYKAPASVTLTAQASTDSGTISQVRFYRGTTLIGTVTAPPYSVTWSTSTVGSYNLTAKATDSAGKVTTSPAVPVTVVANQAPTVSLSSPAPNQVLSAPATVTLTATATDSDGTISKVEFYRGTTLIGTTATAPYTVTWSNAAGGSYSLTAKATDNNGKITTSAAVPIVVNAPPTVSLSSPAANAVLLAGATVTLTATAADKGGSVSKVEFYQGTTLLGTKTASPYTFAWTTVPPGSYTLTAKATDNRGATTTSAARSITVNAPPTVSLTAPAANQTMAAPATVTLTATATDSDGTIAKVDFYRGTTLIGTATTAPYTVTWSNAAAGTYSLSAKATDNRGAAITSAPVSLSVVANQPPTVSLSSPVPNQVLSAPATVTLTATATDSDGTISKVDFYRGGSTLIGTATAAPYTVTWSNAAAGTYALTAKATDNKGVAATSAAVNLKVNALPTVSLTSPGNGAAFVAPASVTLAANASAPGGTLAKVEFYQGTILVGTDTVAPYTATWSNVALGSYSLTAKATDTIGGVTTSAARAITVIANRPPTVSLTSPTNNQSFQAPATVTLTANASDPDNNLAKVEFFNGSTLLGMALAAPYTFDWTGVGEGSFPITAVATDAVGAQVTSSSVRITVAPKPVGIYSIYTDHLGTPRLITDSTDQVVWRHLPTTEAFGNSPPEEDPDADGTRFEFNLRFPGQYFDQETQTHYNYFRDYDPGTGRYVQSDPIGLEGGINTYSYVEGNPISFVDPEGLLLTAMHSLQQGTTMGEAMQAGGAGNSAAVAGAVAAGVTGVAIVGGGRASLSLIRDIALGREYKIGNDFRGAPWGNRTGHDLGKWPHYHRRGTDGDGKTIPGQGIGRHRPWEQKSTDKTWCDRF